MREYAKVKSLADLIDIKEYIEKQCFMLTKTGLHKVTSISDPIEQRYNEVIVKLSDMFQEKLIKNDLITWNGQYYQCDPDLPEVTSENSKAERLKNAISADTITFEEFEI